MKNVRLEKMVDNESCDQIIQLYREIRINDKFSHEDFIKFKSFVYKMVKAQNRPSFGMTWAKPSTFFRIIVKNRPYIKTKQDLISFLLKYITYHPYEYNEKEDYGKIL